MSAFLHVSLVLIGLILAISPVLAFDNDFEINDINLDNENFLDLKAHRYRKSLEYKWFDNTSGWLKMLIWTRSCTVCMSSTKYVKASKPLKTIRRSLTKI